MTAPTQPRKSRKTWDLEFHGPGCELPPPGKSFAFIDLPFFMCRSALLGNDFYQMMILSVYDSPGTAVSSADLVLISESHHIN